MIHNNFQCNVLIQGSIFFPLPDEKGLSFNLIGSADAPKAKDKIVGDRECKVPHVLSMMVDNWLRRPQRQEA